ncbi:hypothetical protein [Sphaerisporangium corydalis]|uniref:LppX_LprAFG lipoprotein n=1 Tax=Sphaerisporangium corydalis TaxID=1441875 RepID=A0ABV9EDI8_9ACTN|nr:hypothetical protein [Sphaerisporangium corydalis]
MKRVVVAFVLVVGSVVGAAPSAQAVREADPVQALKEQYVKGRGVRVVTAIKMSAQHQVLSSRQAGVFQFDGRGQAASDFTERVRFPEDFLDSLPKETRDTYRSERLPMRLIKVLRTGYLSGAVVADDLPKGKSWVRYRWTDLSPSGTLLDIMDAATLRTLMDHATSRRGGVVKGSVTTSRLASVSPSFSEQFGPAGTSRDGRDGKVTYTLWLDSRGLVERLAARAAMPFAGKTLTISMDSRFSRWGGKVSISAPPKEKVIGREKLGKSVPVEPPGLLD